MYWATAGWKFKKKLILTLLGLESTCIDGHLKGEMSSRSLEYIHHNVQKSLHL